MLRTREYTKNEITKINLISEDPKFHAELMVLLEEFRQGSTVKNYLADAIKEDLPLHKATSVTWLVYELCNAFNDHEIEADYLSEVVVDVEDLVEEIIDLIEKYKK